MSNRKLKQVNINPKAEPQEQLKIIKLSSDQLWAEAIAINTDVDLLESSYYGHRHDGEAVQISGVQSNDGAFAFNTTGDVTFNDDIIAPSLTVGTLHATSITHETTDVDTFLVANSGLLKYRTGAEILSDIGAAASSHTQAISTISDSTTVGQNFVKLTSPSAITFPRINADNTVSALSAADFHTAIGTGTPTAHQLDSATYHTVSGLTTGHFLKATGATSFGFGAHGLTYSDVGAAPATHGCSAGYVPYASSTTAWGTSPIITSGTNVGINVIANYLFEVRGGSIGESIASVTHGMTNYQPTNTIFKVDNYNGALGGADIYGLSAGDSYAMWIRAFMGVDNPTDTTAAMVLQAAKKDGITVQALAAAETCFQFKNFTTSVMTILGGGNVGIGYSSPGSFSALANNLVVGSGSGSEGITIYAGADSFSCLHFADTANSGGWARGYFWYNHADDSLTIGSGGNNAIWIDPSQNVALTATKKLYLDGGGDTYITESSANVMDFYTGGALRVSIGSGGNLTMEPSGGGYYSTSDHQWHNGSTRAIKKDIEINDIDVLTTLGDLNVYKWKYKTPSELFLERNPDKIKDDIPKNKDKDGVEIPEVVDNNWHIGFIADETPELLTGFNKDGMATGDCIGFLLAVVKEQQRQIGDLQKQIDEIKKTTKLNNK